MKKILLPFLCIFLSLVSCVGPSEEKLRENMESGVVLVKNTSYYELVLSNNTRLYFSNYDPKEGIQGLAFQKDSVEQSTSFGTGFFVSDKGELITNGHVVSNIVAARDINRSMERLIEQIKLVYAQAFELEREKFNKLLQLREYAYVDPNISVGDYYRLRELCEAKAAELRSYSATYDALNRIRLDDTRIIYHNAISIAYNDSYINKKSAFKPCVIKDVDADHDLAVLQLKSKRTPDGKYVFPIPEKDPLENYTLADNIKKQFGSEKNSRLYMAGFNLGPALAVTSEGIKAQFNNGSVSQKSAERIMYSIPTLPGSSGSPVVNMKGELVAVNYAGLNGTQNFNYGIRVKYLKNLLDK